jgi:hypothetical protein
MFNIEKTKDKMGWTMQNIECPYVTLLEDSAKGVLHQTTTPNLDQT